jgi:hypothetical protein
MIASHFCIGLEWLSLDDADAGSQTAHGKIHRIGWLR